MMRRTNVIARILAALILLSTAPALAQESTAPALAQESAAPDIQEAPAPVLRSAPSANSLDRSSATRYFQEANALYAEGRYGEAAALYARIAASDFGNADVQYNLGNASYKAGALGRAVLAYERALLLDPAHDDARTNLAYTRERLVDRQQPIESGPVVSLVTRAFDRVGAGGLAVAASTLYVLLVVALIVGIGRGVFAPWMKRTAVTLAAALVVVLTAAGAAGHRARTVREAVVLSQEVGVRTGPGEEFVLEFRIHEGTKVRIREERGNWLRVSVSGADLEGWLQRGVVEEIRRTEGR